MLSWLAFPSLLFTVIHRSVVYKLNLLIIYLVIKYKVYLPLVIISPLILFVVRRCYIFTLFKLRNFRSSGSFFVFRSRIFQYLPINFTFTGQRFVKKLCLLFIHYNTGFQLISCSSFSYYWYILVVYKYTETSSVLWIFLIEGHTELTHLSVLLSTPCYISQWLTTLLKSHYFVFQFS